MSGRRTSIASSPVLIGVITVLSLTVAIFVAYNANQGLPFVPAYKVNVEVDDASGLVPNNEVRIAGIRVGFIAGIEKVRNDDGSYTALLKLKLNTTAKPIFADATYIVRQSSTLGLKYLSLNPGTPAAREVAEGGSLSLAHAGSPVELQDWFDIFDYKTRANIRASLAGWGSALAGRGVSINQAIQSLRPLTTNLQPLMATLAAPSTDLDAFVANLSETAQIVAPAATALADLFVGLDTTFAALAVVAPQLQEFIAAAPEAELIATRSLHDTRPFLRSATRFATAFRPDARELGRSAGDLSRAVSAGADQIPRLADFNEKLEDSLRTLDGFAQDANVTLAVDELTQTTDALGPYLSFVTPAQTTCNYLTLLLRNAASLLSEGSPGLTNWQRFTVILPPTGTNSIGFPAASFANGPELANRLHANPYPNTAAPGQNPKECEAAKEIYTDTSAVIGNPGGSSGTKTEGK